MDEFSAPLNPLIGKEIEELPLIEKEIRIKNICPVIGMISSGKSSILNSLLNIDFLEATPQVTTKIVTIIRYNKDAKENPKFYKLSLLKEENKGYKFYKDKDSEIIGSQKIKKEIKRLNKELNQKVPKYKDIFYMLELGEAKFIEEKFLENYDLADIPGVSEDVDKNQNDEKQININNGNSGDAQNAANLNKSKLGYTPSTEEELEHCKIENEINYLTEIFKILKNYMKNGIFIFSIDKYQLAENYQIIGKLKLILDKPIENFLILLNKMDISTNIEEDIQSLNGRFLQEFPKGGFNITRNTIIQCSAFQLENELNMDKKFSNILYYHYINFIMNSKKYKDFIESFKEFIKNFLKKEIESIDRETFEKNIKSIEDDEEIKSIKEIIIKINKNHDVIKYKFLLSENDFNEESIKKCLVDLEEDDDGKINLIDQGNNTLLILYYFYLFKNKKFTLFKSTQTHEILNYFTIKNMNKDLGYEEVQKKLNELQKKEIYNKKVDDLIKIINNFLEKYEKTGININLRESVIRSMKPMINDFKTSKMFYIPLIGVYNSGKSTILNDIIGYNLLPTKQGECTKKGILIRHWDFDIPILRKAKFIVENNENDNDICYFQVSDDIITQGDENVKNILKGLNCNFIDKEEDFFYMINVKIKFLDIFINNDDIKENICFVDLPGYGTKNKFEEKNVYSKFIKSCKLFLMVSRDYFDEKCVIEKINNIIKNTSVYQGISIQSLIKKFLFIINPSKNLDLSENSLLKQKNSLSSKIQGLNENANKDLNVTFFNALFYKYYLSKKKYFSSINFALKKEERHYKKDKESFQEGKKLIDPGKFEKYFLKILKDNNLKSTFGKTLKEISSIDIDAEINETVDKLFQVKEYSFSQQDLKNIKIILSYAKINIEKCKYIIESNYSNFRFYLFERIITSKNDANIEFKKSIENNLDNLKKIFHNDNNLKSGEAPVYKQIKNDADKQLKEFKKEISEKIKDIKSDKFEKDVPKIFEECIENIINYLKNLSGKIEYDLQREKWKAILTRFEEEFKKEINIQKGKIISTLEDFSESLKKHYNEAFQIINKFKNNAGDNFQMEDLKIYISNQLGERNDYKEAISNIVNDILSDSRNATNWENSTGFFGYLKCKFSDKAYLNKTIDFIINNTYERLKDFRKTLSKHIEKYMEIILDKIKIEEITLINNLEEEKRIQVYENQRNQESNDEKRKKYEKKIKEDEEIKQKWNILCQEYDKLDQLIKKIINNNNLFEFKIEENENGKNEGNENENENKENKENKVMVIEDSTAG